MRSLCATFTRTCSDLTMTGDEHGGVHGVARVPYQVSGHMVGISLRARYHASQYLVEPLRKCPHTVSLRMLRTCMTKLRATSS